MICEVAAKTVDTSDAARVEYWAVTLASSTVVSVSLR